MKKLLLALSILILARAEAIPLPVPVSTEISSAVAKAKKSNQPMLISFYGIWCPPCNELEETVFESLGFLEKAKKFVVLKVDADKPESWELKNKYHVGGYPTVVFTNPKGEEIYRVVGYRTPKEFIAVMDLVLASHGQDFKKACKSKNEADLFRCAVVCTEREDKACAEKAFGTLRGVAKKGTAIYDQVETYFADNAPTVDLKRMGYERLLSDNNDSPEALVWATSYLETFSEKVPSLKPKKELIEKVLSLYPGYLKDERQETLGIPTTDMAQMRADLLEKTGRVEEAKVAWKEASDMLEAKAKELGEKSNARGFTIERIGCLSSAGQKQSALELANTYRAKYPEEFTFHYQAASILEGLKQFNDATSAAEKAYSVSYGDNKIRAATLLIKLYGMGEDKDKAKTVFEQVTKEITPDSKLQVRTHRYLKRLQETWDLLDKKRG